MNELSKMKWYLSWVMGVLAFLSIRGVQAQTSSNTVKYEVTYNAVTQTYTAWAVPDYSTPNSNNTGTNELVSTAQFTLKVPIGFTIQNIANATGTQSWDIAPVKYGQGLPLPLTGGGTIVQDYGPGVLDPNYAYYVIGKSPTESNLGSFVAGTPVALFTFQGNGCFGPIMPMGPSDAFIQAALDTYGFNVPNSFYSKSGQGSSGNQIPLEQYIDNTANAAASCTLVGIISPANNGTATTSPTVSGTATPGSVVTLTGPAGTTLCTTTASASGTYSCPVSVPSGPNSITAVACIGGGCSTPAVTSFTAVGPPSLTVVQPTTPGGTTQPITGTATPGSTVAITGPGNTTLCTTTASVSGTFSCPVTVPVGPNTLTVTASNPGGSTSVPVSVTAQPVPTVGITSPATNGTATTSPIVSGTATPGSVVTLTGPAGTTLCTTTASAAGTYSCPVNVPAGPNSITAVACDAGGCSTPAVSNFTAVGPPSLTVVQPTTPGGTTQPITGTATPGSTVAITGPGNTTLCTTTASVSGTFSCPVSVPTGVTTLTVTASNPGGTTSVPVSVTAQPVPTVGITSPATNGTATPGSVVTLTGPGNTTLCTTTASAAGTYSCPVNVPAGPNSITAVACDAGGCSTPAVTSFTAVGPPSLTVVQPTTPGGTTQPITGTATPGSTVAITGPGNTTLCTTTASVSGTFSCPVSVPAGPSTLTVTASNPGGITSVPVTVTAVATTPDLTIAMGPPASVLGIGQTSQIPVTITNIGTAPATGQLTFRITLPTGLVTPLSTYTAGNGWTCAAVGTQLACSTTNPGSLTAGQSTTFAIQVQPTAPPQSVTLVGRVDPVPGEVNLPNNSTTLVVGTTAVAFQVPVKVNLQGALIAGSPLTMMRDDLRAKGLLPTTEPYTGRGYGHIGGGGAETTTTGVFSVTGANAIVDWVVVELRSGSSPTSVVATRSALVQRDGDVVDVDGVSSLTFGSGVTLGTSYYVAVHHRNHLGVMAANAVVAAPLFPLTDFTSSATALYRFPVGNLRRSSVPLATEQGKLALWAGDTNGDGLVIAQGPTNDLVPIFTDVINAPGNAAAQATNYVYSPIYLDSDVDMDGQVIFQGPGNEPNSIIFNVLLHPDNLVNQFNNYVINQQIP